MISKRGISGVVTAILLILLAIAAVIIVWSVVKPLIESPSKNAQTDCVTVDLDITSAAAGATSVTVKRNAGAGDVKGVKIVSPSTTIGQTTTTTCSGAINELDTKACTLASGAKTLATGDVVEAYAMVGDANTICPNGATKTV